MRIGLLQIELHLPGCQSLKEKRAILQSVKHRLRSRHNISLAEIDHHDLWQRSMLGIVAIGVAADSIEKIFRAVIVEFESRPDLSIIDEMVEML